MHKCLVNLTALSAAFGYVQQGTIFTGTMMNKQLLVIARTQRFNVLWLCIFPSCLQATLSRKEPVSHASKTRPDSLKWLLWQSSKSSM
jgi:hypothetical protein